MPDHQAEATGAAFDAVEAALERKPTRPELIDTAHGHLRQLSRAIVQMQLSDHTRRQFIDHTVTLYHMLNDEDDE